MENYGLSAPTGGIVEYIRQLAESYAQRLAARVALRKEEMAPDETGHYLSGGSAWSYVKNHTGVDLKAILEAMAKERASGY